MQRHSRRAMRTIIILTLAAMLILAVLSWGICRQILRRRIRAIVRKSIIENIREL